MFVAVNCPIIFELFGILTPKIYWPGINVPYDNSVIVKVDKLIVPVPDAAVNKPW